MTKPKPKPETNSCHICKDLKQTTKETLRVQLAHEVAVPLTMSVSVCGECKSNLATGVDRVRNTKLVLVA